MKGITRLAIQAFEKLERAKYREELLTVELESYVKQIPDGELNEYIAKTEEIRRKFDEKRRNNPKLRGYIYRRR